MTTRHLLTHCPTIIHEFGTRCYVRCIWRSLTKERPVTFLECIDFAPSPALLADEPVNER